MEVFYYKPNSIPLEAVELNEIPNGVEVYSELGICMRKISVNGESYMEEIEDSVLIEGELMRDLTLKQLQLFWSLSNNRKKIEYEDKGASKG